MVEEESLSLEEVVEVPRVAEESKGLNVGREDRETAWDRESRCAVCHTRCDASLFDLRCLCMRVTWVVFRSLFCLLRSTSWSPEEGRGKREDWCREVPQGLPSVPPGSPLLWVGGRTAFFSTVGTVGGDWPDALGGGGP